MSKYGAQPINDVGKTSHKLAYQFNGEDRIDIRPNGRVERFVDPQGNVMNIQLASLGEPNVQAAMVRKRDAHHRDGFVEHAKCPLRHGTHVKPAMEKDFAAMPADLGQPCAADPKTLVRTADGVEARKACPHIEWLIAYRVEKERKANAKRKAAQAAIEAREAQKAELQLVQLEIAKEELEARKARKGRKADS